MKFFDECGHWISKKEQGGHWGMESQCGQSCRGDNELGTVGRSVTSLMSFAGCRQGFYICFELPSSQLAPKCVRAVAGLVARPGLS